MEVPCPQCEATFIGVDELLNHALISHHPNRVAQVLRRYFMRKLTKDSFTQVDSHWVCVVDGFQLSLSQDKHGEFRLLVSGTLEPIPPATQYPTEPEWDKALELSNKFLQAFVTANSQEF